MNLSKENKNYKNLVDQAEGAFLKKEFLEAFLIQSCVIEGVLKNYASVKLSYLSSNSQIFKNKLDSFEFAKLADNLFAAGKISENLYENLDKYRKKRNEVIHKLLEYENKEKLDRELQEVYNLGKDMKGFIVEDMAKEIKGQTVAELEAEINNLMSQLKNLHSQLKEVAPDLSSKIKDMFSN